MFLQEARRNLTVLFLFLAAVSYSQTPSWQWAESGAGSASDNGMAIATDASGNVYVTGYFYSSSISFGSYTLTNTGNYEAYLVKFNSAGNALWAKAVNGIYDEVGSSVATDGSGNIYLTGYFTSPVITAGSYTLSNPGTESAFVFKYDSLGNVVWAKTIGGGGVDESHDIATDKNGNVYVTGQFQSSTMVFGTYTLSNSGAGDIFVAKYDSSGTELWALLAGGAGQENAWSLTTDPNKNVIVTGYFRSDTLVRGNDTLYNTSGSSDVIILKCDSAGNSMWAKGTGSNFEDTGCDVACDAGGNIYMTGYFKSASLNFGVYTCTNSAVTSCDIFLTKYSPAGNEQWAQSAGGSYDDIAYGVICDPAGNVSIAGHLHSPSVTFSTYTLTNAGIGDAYIAKYNPAGNVLWALSAGGTSDDGASGIATDAGGNTYVTGFFYSAFISFGSIMMNSSGNADMFVAKSDNVMQAENFARDETAAVIFPNPSHDKFYIRAGASIQTIELYDALGNKLFCRKPLSQQADLDLSNFPAGVYFAEIHSEKSVIRKKLVLNK